MTRFLDLDTAAFAGATLIVDVDGTLVPDRQGTIGSAVLSKLSTFTAGNDVYLCSNGSPAHAREFARAAGVGCISALKPFPGEARALAGEGKRVVVIGDKYLTDGIFAALLGAEFVRVDHERSPDDTFFARSAYTLDAIAWAASPAVLALRPWHWVKNLLVFAPIFFAARVFDVSALGHSTLAFLTFCAAASAMYIVNDLADIERDRQHPKKRFRPIPSGALAVPAAQALLVALIGVTLGIVPLVPAILLPIAAYIALNLAYSHMLKHVAVVDIACVAAFYLLRIAAGGLAAAVPLSPWIMLCALFGSLFVVIGKRRAEALRASRRSVLDDYSPAALDFMLISSASLAIMAYGIYSVIGHSSPYLVYSTGFVAFALFRMLNRMYTHPEDAESPELLVFKDRWILGSFLAWVAYAFTTFYVV